MSLQLDRLRRMVVGIGECSWEYVLLQTISIEYQFIADGHGSIPQWLADHLALKSVWKSMRNIRRQLPDKKWQQKKVSGITEISMNQFPIIDKTAIPE